MNLEEFDAERAERMLSLAADARPHLEGTDGPLWMDKLERNYDGLRTAFSWLLAQGRGTEALQMAADLWLFQEERGYAEEARAWLARSLAETGANARTVTRARALYGAGILAFRKLDEDAAQRAFQECLAIAQEVDSVRLIVRANTGLARLALRQGDTEEVRRRSAQGLAVARERGERSDMATPIHMLAAAARVDGDFSRARAFYHESLALNRELQRPQAISTELENLGALEVLEGHIPKAAPLLRESLQMAYERRDIYLAPYDLVWLGRVASAQGNPARAAKLFAAARALFESAGLAMDPDEAPEYEKGLAAVRERMDESAFASAWAEGKKMSFEDAVAFALVKD